MPDMNTNSYRSQCILEQSVLSATRLSRKYNPGVCKHEAFCLSMVADMTVNRLYHWSSDPSMLGRTVHIVDYGYIVYCT